MGHNHERLVRQIMQTSESYFGDIVRSAAAADLNLYASPAPPVSPIEELFGLALSVVARCSHYGRAVFFGFRNQNCLLTEVAALTLYRHAYVAGADGMMAFSQVVIAKYTVDFLILYPAEGRVCGIIVECDGHDFHEKTKQQASSDKERDRILQERGYKVFRFSGADVWGNAIACAKQVWGSARKAMTLGDDPGLRRIGHLIEWDAPK